MVNIRSQLVHHAYTKMLYQRHMCLYQCSKRCFSGDVMSADIIFNISLYFQASIPASPNKMLRQKLSNDFGLATIAM